MGKTKDNSGHGEPEPHGTGADDRDTLHDVEPPGIDLSRTIPTGAAFHATWKMPAVKPASSAPPAAAVSGNPAAAISGNNDSGVRKLDLPAEDAQAKSTYKGNQTLISMVPGVMPTPKPEPSPTPDLTRIPHDSLGRTQRMEIGISSYPPPGGESPAAAHGHHVQHNEPRDTLEPQIPSAAVSATRKAAFSRANENVVAAAVARVGEMTEPERTSTRPASFRSTDPFGNPTAERVATAAVGTMPNPETASSSTSSDRPQPTSDRAAAKPSDRAPQAGAAAQQSDRVPSDRAPSTKDEPEVVVEPRGSRKRSDRPDPRRAYAEQRLGVTAAREYARMQPAASSGSSLSQSWMLSAGLVASGVVAVAFGIFMVFMRPGSEETIEPIADATGDAPHVVTPAPLPNTQGAKQPASAPAAAPSAPAAKPAAAAALAPMANTTVISSNPSGAEVVLGGALVANTPTRVAHASYDVDYLVRMPGYEPQLMRIGPKSPQQITVQLTTMKPEAQK